ncbi:hypothetical protein ABMX92_18250 [Vibrio vulnificus]|uniref:hypothetical protein n=1 Tax=Vibrio vulnificus TaxID=672 RepID=UPI0009B65464|nr:hypothetical protein [Vibrio vulnificus]ELP5730762.1 hypothetical protein [Vibrio vulnificus]ELQ2466571.1 hypothetical protein [Vibrio vulnificus]OQK50671.1 hypothetical protein XM75_c11580 [Vibrio vulnificus]
MEIKLILYLLIWICIFSAPVFVCLLVRKRSIRFKAWLTSFIVSWGFMVLAVFVLWLGYDLYISYKMGLLDIDGDGMWSNQEMESWTEDDHNTMKRHFGDGGRNVFALFIFPILSLLYSLLVTVMYWLIANKFGKMPNKLLNRDS